MAWVEMGKACSLAGVNSLAVPWGHIPFQPSAGDTKQRSQPATLAANPAGWDRLVGHCF